MRLLIKSELNLFIRGPVNGSTKNRKKKPNQLARTECIYREKLFMMIKNRYLLNASKRILILLCLVFAIGQSNAQVFVVPVSISATSSAPACVGQYSGSITINGGGGLFSGATQNYTFYIDSGAGNELLFTVFDNSGDTTITNLKAGTYQLLVEDKNGDEDSTIIVVTDPAALSLNINQYNPKCFNELGGVKLIATGGTSAVSYSYKKENGTFSTVDTFGSLSAGIAIKFFVLDDNFCLDSASVTLIQPTSILDISEVVVNSLCDGNGSVTFTPSGGTSPYEIDKNGSGTFSSSLSYSGLMDNAGVKAFVKDANGCLDSTTYSIQHTDAAAPNAIAQNITIYLDSATGMATANADDADNGSTDDCAMTFSLDKTAFDCEDRGNNAVVFTATDPDGRTGTANITVEVLDTIKPAALPYYLTTVYLDSSGALEVTYNQIDSASFDACGIDTITLSQLAFSCAHAGDTIDVNFLVEDSSGNKRGTTAKIAVLDTFAPDLQLRTLGNRPLDYYGADTLHIDSVVLSTFDACDGGTADTVYFASVTDTLLYFDCDNKGSNTIGVYAVDKNGNKRYKEVTFNIIDDRKPDSLQLKDTVLYLDNTINGGSASFRKQDVVLYTYDNCGTTDTTVQTAYNCSHIGSNSITVTVKDDAGNSLSKNMEVYVLDTFAPSFKDVKTITRYLDSSGADTVLTTSLFDTVDDNCAVDKVYSSDTFFTCTDTGVHKVVLYAEDASGNLVTDTATITIFDTLAPFDVVITDTITVYLGSDGTYTLHDSDYLISAMDNCEISDTAYSQQIFTCTDILPDPVTVYLEFVDPSGNTTYDTLRVFVEDTLAPIVLARERDTVYVSNTLNGPITLNVTDIDSASADNANCSPLNLTLGGNFNIDCSDVNQEVEVYLIGTDAFGNSGRDTTIVLVLDTVKPVIVLRTFIPDFYVNAIGEDTIQVSDIDGGSTDNCGIALREITGQFITCADAPSKDIVFRVVDKYGNESTETITVNVIDTVRPQITVQNAIIVIDTSGKAMLDKSQVVVVSSDNCGVDTITLSKDEFDLSNVGLNNVDITITDKSANATTKTVEVTVIIGDADKDSIPDYVERNVDTDGDGTLDYLDIDSDNDGLNDSVENNQKHALVDSDSDGVPDYLDLDSDNDGINDVIENGSNDTDGDGLNDDLTNVSTVALDTDADGVPDYRDLDSDSDGLWDVLESLQGHTDANDDGIIDDATDTDTDGIVDEADGASANRGDNGDLAPADADTDGNEDFREIDSDNDGIPDSIEGNIDTDADGTADYRDTDSDGDGIPDAYEAGSDPTNPVDTDGDGDEDFRDTDSDDDTIPDSVEAGSDPTNPEDSDNDGTDDFRDIDSDGDKIPDEIEAGSDPTNPVDSDSDGTPDYLDLDSDNDDISDEVEAGSDPTNPLDSDNDGDEDFRDIDADGDGISDKEEGVLDADGDGIPNYLDTDSDDDGVDDIDEGNGDSDNNGIPDYLDAQFRIPEAFSPNADGVNDVFFIKGLKVFDEAQLIVFNRNGQVVFDSGNGYKNDWAGTNNSSMPGIGSDLPEGLYYYVFKPNGLNKEDVTGNLYIKR